MKRTLHWLRRKIETGVQYLNELYKAARFCRADAVLLEGKERHSGQSIRVFYVGKRKGPYEWISNLIFSEFETKEIRRKVLSLNAAKWVRTYEGKSDIVVLDLGYIYGRFVATGGKQYISIPYWIGQKRDIADNEQELLGSFRRQNKLNYINRIKKNNVIYRIATAEDDFRDFYCNYYLPYHRKRFGDAFEAESEKAILRRCRKGKVMQILHDGRVIAYALNALEPGRLTTYWFGVSQSIDGEISKIVFNAIYYYSVMYGFEKKCREVDFRYAKPLLTDGVYKYKKMWGAHVFPAPWFVGNMLVKPTNLDSPVSSVFANNYFVTSQGDALIAKISCGEEEISIRLVENIMKNCYAKGIDAIRVYSLKKVDRDVAAWARENAPPVQLVDLSDVRNPEEAFCG
jgi:hypothetical protein